MGSAWALSSPSRLHPAQAPPSRPAEGHALPPLLLAMAAMERRQGRSQKHAAGLPVVGILALDIYFPSTCVHQVKLILIAAQRMRRADVLVSMYEPKTIKVWVLIDDDQWTLQRSIHVPITLNWTNDAFFPRSGCLLAEEWNEREQELVVVDFETGSSRLISCLYPKDPRDRQIRYPYEMDWSTYLSRMKNF